VPAAAESPTTSPAAERRRELRAQRREELLDAAIDVVRRDGPNVSMDQIAAECGITKPIIYRHFGDRDGLLAELALRFVGRLIDLLRPAAATDAPAHDLLRHTIDAYLELIETDTNVYRFLRTQVHSNRDDRDVLAGLFAEQIAVIMDQRLTDAGLDPMSARPWAYALVGMVHFTGDWWIDQRAPNDRDHLPRHELTDQLTFLVWDGLAGLDLDRRAAARRAPTTRARPSRRPDRSTP